MRVLLLLLVLCGSVLAEDMTPTELAVMMSLESIDKLPDNIGTARYLMDNQQPLLAIEYMETITNSLETLEAVIPDMVDPRWNPVQEALIKTYSTCSLTSEYLSKYRTDRSISRQLSISQSECSRSKDRVLWVLQELMYGN